MKRDIFKYFLSALLIPMCLQAQSFNKTSIPTVFSNANQFYRWEFFDGNRIKCTISNYGPFADYRRTNSSGFFWPKGTSKTAIYTAGILIAGIHRGTGEIRTAIQDYSSEYQPGPILGLYHSAQYDSTALSDPSDARYRVYKIRAGDSKIDRDYREWPGDLGAPFVDVNGNGTWDPAIDHPWNIGSQTLWSVYNDGNPKNHANVTNSKPMGLEVQATYFGFDNVRFLQDVMFVKWKIINKSDAFYDNTFFGIWHDADLGDASDDCVGIDTTKWISYVYNGDNDDGGASGYGNTPPALGFVMLQTPIVRSLSLDSGLAWNGWKRGFQNIQPYAFMPFFNCYECGPFGPIGGDFFLPRNFPLEVFRSLNGLDRRTGNSIIDPMTSTVTKFPFAGDPVDSIGWIQSITMYPNDVRGVYSVGPMTLAPGDTQEVVAAIIMAQGDDRLKSITTLRLYSDLTKEFFDNNYTLYKIEEPTPSPKPVPQQFILTQNYPNPFNPKTVISYSLPQFDTPYPVVLRIYNTLGIETATLVNEYKPGGTYSIEWNAGNQPSGIYFCRLSIAGLVVTKKMTLLK